MYGALVQALEQGEGVSMADIELVIKIPEDSYKATCSGLMLPPDVKNVVNAIKNDVSLPKGHGRKFEEIVVEYPPAELCTYPEYRGKPYFSIKYEENGEHIIGFGTYKPEVLSSYLREYFIAQTIIKADKEAENE
jgi:hypothetical protein